MSIIDFEKLEAVGPEEFRRTSRYPHSVWHDLIRPEAYDALVETLPPLEHFAEIFGKSRKAGQDPHDRYSLEYRPGLEVARPWQAFIDELRGPRYRGHLARLLGARRVEFRFHWHYTPAGCAVSPHCDSRRELGSHLFYFNPEKSWRPEWGGQTLLLDDQARLDPRSAPDFEDFEVLRQVECVGNASALLARGDRCWHGVRPITSPEGRLRKVFIVVVNPVSYAWRVRDWAIGKRIQRL